MKHYNIPIFVVHFGCPNMCVFCNQKKITGVETDITIKDIEDTIEKHIRTIPEKAYKEVAFFGGSFTGIKQEIQLDYLKTVKKYIDKGLINGIRLSTRPDYINEKNLEILKEYKVTTIELGIQSFDQQVLDISERGYKKDIIYKAIEAIKNSGIKLGIQIMPGLPGADMESDINGTKEIVKINPDMVRIYPTLVISDTKLERMYNENKYIPLSLNEAVDRVMQMLALLEINNIDVIRVGLQPSEDLREEGVIIAGPFHPAFRELVETEIYYNFLDKILIDNKNIEVEVNKKNISKVKGMNKKNLLRFGSKLLIKENNDIKLNEILVNNKIYKREDVLKIII